MTMLSQQEAQELHEAIGAAIKAEDTNGLPRARELAAVLVSDTQSDQSDTKPEDRVVVLGLSKTGADVVGYALETFVDTEAVLNVEGHEEVALAVIAEINSQVAAHA